MISVEEIHSAQCRDLSLPAVHLRRVGEGRRGGQDHDLPGEIHEGNRRTKRRGILFISRDVAK